MAHVRTLSGMNDSGFDASRSLLVLSTTKTSTLYLVEGGSDNLTVVIDDPEVASCVEKDETKAHKKDTQRKGLCSSLSSCRCLKLQLCEARSAHKMFLSGVIRNAGQ